MAIHGSSRVRNWKRLQFPKVTILPIGAPGFGLMGIPVAEGRPLREQRARGEHQQQGEERQGPAIGSANRGRG